MRHVWIEKEWKDIRLCDVKDSLLFRARSSPRLGDLSVRELCCLAKSPWSPVGIYVFSKDSQIIYTGKTHGRSFHERMLSHIDHREPIAGSPHLAQLAQSLLKKGGAQSADEAVEKILEMHITWLPIARNNLDKRSHQLLIAHTERRLLWSKCLDPFYNSPRVKHNDSFTLKGIRYHLSSESLLGEQVSISRKT